MRIKNILVPYDYSECALNALDHTGNIADLFESRILIFHVIDEQILGDRDLKAHKEEHLDKILKTTDELPSLSNDQIDVYIEKATKQEAITNAIEKLDIDLVIMGTHRRDYLFEDLINSNTFKAIKRNKVPVLVIPDGVDFRPVKKIGLASDFKQIEHTSALDVVMDFCYAFKADIEIFHIVDKKSQNATKEVYEVMQLDDYFHDLPHSFHEMKDDNTALAISSFIVDHNIDLLAIMPRKHTLKELLHKSLTKDMVEHLQLPILVFHE